MPAERPSGTGHDTARPVPEWVTLKAVASIIRHAAAGAENNKGGLTECSAAALNSWAEVIERNLPVSVPGPADPVVSPADTPPERPYYEVIIRVNPTYHPAKRAVHIAEGIGYACALLMDEYGWSAERIADVLERVTDDVADQEAQRAR